jgi:drug/metabolite transporter (DMT)-like permease
VYGFALALLAAALFGASTPASKVLLERLSPLQLAGLLYLGAALAMAPVVVVQRRTAPAPRLDRANRLRLGGAVFFGGIAGPLLLLVGLRLSLAASVSLLLNLEMVATAVLGLIFFGEHLGRAGWVGVAGVVIASALLGGEGGWPGILSALLVAGACICWGIDNHLTALIDGITPSHSTFWKGSVAGATNLAIGLLVAPWEGSVPILLGALLVGGLSYGASISLYIGSAQQIGATRAQMAFATAPFLGALLSFGLLGERFEPVHGVAGVLLLGAVALLFLDLHEHHHEHAPTEHIHSHRHDDGHHLHEHPDLSAGARHSHWHRHERLVHSHPHWPDLHHRHPHQGEAEGGDPHH